MGENLDAQSSPTSDDKYLKRSIMCRQLGYSTLLSFFLGFFGLLGVYQLSDRQVTTLMFAGLLLLHVVITLMTGKLLLPRNLIEWCIASGLGASTAAGVITFFKSTSYFAFGSYVFVMSLFHFGEYFATALTNPSNLSVDSFLLNHGVAYTIAAVASWTEFFLELWLCPKLKSILPMTIVGVIICILGDLLRKSAMFKAGESFSHIVQSTKKESHKLVVSGVYSMMRHPSYVGWFYWSVGTQIALCNPFCFIMYAFVSWKFFHERVFIEEQTLLSFFGDDYLNYQKAVPVGIPGISGFVVKTDL